MSRRAGTKLLPCRSYNSSMAVKAESWLTYMILLWYLLLIALFYLTFEILWNPVASVLRIRSYVVVTGLGSIPNAEVFVPVILSVN